MAAGDISAVRIVSDPAHHNGFVLEIDVLGMSVGGTYDFGLGSGNDPADATVTLTVTSPGYSAAGAVTTIQRTVYGTQWIRKLYPDQAEADELEGVDPAEGMTIAWTASPDHDEVDPITGDPLISSYEIRVYDAATDELIGTEDVGKPTPVDDIITVTGIDLLDDLDPGDYRVVVVALGPHAAAAPDQVAVSYSAEFTVS